MDNYRFKRAYEFDFKPKRGRLIQDERENQMSRWEQMMKKVIIFKFNGASDLEVYLAREMKVDKIFNSYDYEDEDKVLMATLEFKGYVMNWWNQIIMDINKRRRRPITTWEQLKDIMNERFVPSYYKHELFNKLQGLTKSNRGVEEYVQDVQDLEVTLMKANVDETPMTTMVRLLNDLNREIQDVVEMHHYETLEDLIHQATKVEQHNSREKAYTRSHPPLEG